MRLGRRLAVDVRSLMDQPTGIGRYTAQLVQAALDCGFDEVVLYSFGGRRPSVALQALLASRPTTFVHHPLPMRIARQLWRRVGQPALESILGSVDAVLASETTCPSTRAPVLAVVHDVLFLDHPEWFNAYVRRAGPENLHELPRRATAAITTTEVTRARVASALPAFAPDLLVVPPALEPIESHAWRPAPADPTVLFVGTREPRKGLGTVAQALLLARGPARRARLVVVGKAGWGRPPGSEALAALEAQGRLDVRGWTPESTLRRLRAEASVAVVPSLDEGFGLPLLEALAAGVPVVASDIPVFREVSDGACLLAPPNDVTAWASVLDCLLSAPSEQETLSARGRARAMHFSPVEQQAALARALETLA